MYRTVSSVKEWSYICSMIFEKDLKTKKWTKKHSYTFVKLCKDAYWKDIHSVNVAVINIKTVQYYSVVPGRLE